MHVPAAAQTPEKKSIRFFTYTGLGYSRNYSKILDQKSIGGFSAQTVPIGGATFELGVNAVRNRWLFSLGFLSCSVGDYFKVSGRLNGQEGSIFMSNRKTNYFFNGFIGYKTKILFFDFVPSIGIQYAVNSKLVNGGGEASYGIGSDTVTIFKRINSVNPSPLVYGANLKLGFPIKLKYYTMTIVYNFLLASAANAFYRTEGMFLINNDPHLVAQVENSSLLSVHSIRIELPFRSDSGPRPRGKRTRPDNR